MRQTRMNHHALRSRLRRKITLVANAYNFFVETESKQNLRGRRQ